MEGFELLQQGAEARIYQGLYLGKPAIAKERFQKKYRHPSLDSSLTKERIRAEARAIVRCKGAGIRTPTIYFVDFERRIIFMEYFVHSITLKKFLETMPYEKCIQICFTVGKTLGLMHENNIIHGDLTSSNMLLVNKHNHDVFDDLDDLHLVLIDFGLAHVESSVEDKGVDLYVLERALVSTHEVAAKVFPKLMDGYRKQNKSGCKEVFAKYEEVRARGRKRTMVG